MNRKFTEEDKKFIEEKYPILGAIGCSKIWDKFTPDQIARKAQSLKIKFRSHISNDSRCCTKCQIIKKKTEFYAHHGKCKPCTKAAARASEANKLSKHKYYQKHKVRIKKYILEYKAKRRARDINYKVLDNLRGRIFKAVRFNIKSARTLQLIGCSVEELKLYLEKQFKLGMTWDNYGFYGWHIDHIKPCHEFDLSDACQQAICFHYTNLQPLWAGENLRRPKKIHPKN